MKLPQYRRITKTDHEDMPDWFEPVADTLNRHIESLTVLAHGNATFSDNHLSEVRTLEMANDTVVSIKLNVLKRNPTGVLVLASSFFEYYRLAWQMSPTSPLTVDIKVKWDSAPANNPAVTLLFLGG